MPLVKQTVSFPFRGGLDTKTDPRQTPVAKLQVLENAVFTRPGSLRKRFGFAALPTRIANPYVDGHTTLTDGQALAAFNNELLLADPTRLYSLDEGTAAWIDKGPLVSARVTQTPIIRNAYGQTFQDGAIHPSGLQGFVWEDSSGGCRYSIVDYATGQTVVSSTLISLNARKPKVLAAGNFLVILYVDVSDAAAPVLMVATVPVANPTSALSPTQVTAGAGGDFRQLNPTAPVYAATVSTTEVAVGGPPARMYMAFNSNIGGGGLTVYSFLDPIYDNPDSYDNSISGFGSLPVLTIFTDAASSGPVVAAWDGFDIDCVAWQAFQPGDENPATVASNVFEHVSNYVFSVTGVGTSSLVPGRWTVCFTIWDPTDKTFNALTKTFSFEDYSATGSPAPMLRSVALSGKAFAYKGLAYFPLVYQSPLESTYFVADQNGNLVMRALATLAGPFPYRGDGLGSNPLPETTPVNPADPVLIAPPAHATGLYTISDASGLLDWTISSLGSGELPAGQNVGGVIGGVGSGFQTWTTDDATSAADVVTLMNADAGINTQVSAASVGPVLTVTAVVDGVVGNAISLAGRGTNVVASGPSLAGGVDGAHATGTFTINAGEPVYDVYVNGNHVSSPGGGGFPTAATALAAALNADSTVNLIVHSVAVGAVVTMTAVTPGTPGNSTTISQTSGGIAVFPVSGLLAGGTVGSFATGTLTFGAFASGTFTITGGQPVMDTYVGGNHVTSSGSGSNDDIAAAMAVALNLDPAVSLLVFSSATGPVVTMTALTPGPSQNAITISSSEPTYVVRSGPTLTGGATARGMTDADVATNLASQIGTTGSVGAAAVGNAVVLTATVGGLAGNLIEYTASGIGFTPSDALLTGGAAIVIERPDSEVWRLPCLVKDFLTTFPSTTSTVGTNGQPITTAAVYTQTGVTALTLDFYSQTNSYLRAALGGSMTFGGGFLTQYDGTAPVELGFHVSPELTTSSVVTATMGGALGSGTQSTSYWWVVTYEWTDNTGRVYRSTPSIPVNQTFSSSTVTGMATITIPTLRLTSKSGASPVTINVYRTTGTSPGVFYLASNSVVPAASGAVNQPILNDMTVDSVTFVDVLGDGVITGYPQLYSTGNVLENSAPPPCNDLVVYQNRLFGISSENPLVIFYSQQVIPGQAINFSDFLTLNLDPQIGSATALAVIDDKLIIFGQSSIYWLNGQGPDATGNTSYPDPQLIPGDVGCDNPRSIVSTDQGVGFQSAKGIWLLNRSNVVSYAGADVEQLVNGATVTSAHMIPTTTQVRFGLDTGQAVVLDTLVGQWSTYNLLDAVDATIWAGQYTWLRADGAAFEETPDAYSDAGQPITTSLTTAPIRLAGLAGFQRVRLLEILGTYESPHELEVSVTYDGNPASTQTVTVAPNTPDTWGSDATWGSGDVWGGQYVPYIWRVYLNQQKCESVQISIRDTQEGVTPGQGMSLAGLTFEISALRGAYKLPASSTFGG